MTEHTCRWAGTDQPRMLRSHLTGCQTDGCPGCQPCPERHCQVATPTAHGGCGGTAHVTADGHGHDQTCATCLSLTRRHLTGLTTMAAALLGEAITRGLNSNAAHLAGPTADPEAWGHRRMSALANRIDPRWLDDQIDMHHPAWTLGTWVREARLHLNQPTHVRPTLTEARDYLDGHLTRLAHDPDFAFDELATDVRHCHAELERTLHLDETPERGAPCPECGRADLEKSWGKREDDDRWTCPRCGQSWTEPDYRRRIAGLYLGVAEVLTASQITETYRVPESTVRRWASGWVDGSGVRHDPVVGRRGHDGQRRQLYVVADVLAMRDGERLAS